MGCQNWLRLCHPSFLPYFWQSSWCDVKCKLSRGHSVHDMVYYAIWNCTSINLVNNEQTPSAKNLWCQTCLHLKGSRCKNHILKCITIPGSDYKNATTHFIHFSSLVTYYFSNNKKGDVSHEKLVWLSSRWNMDAWKLLSTEHINLTCKSF